MEEALATDSVTALLLPLLATQQPRGCNRSNVPPLVGAGVGSVPVPPTGLTVVSKMRSPSAQPRLKTWIRSIENALERPLIRMV